MQKKSVLYILATPIGNLDDISRRALDILQKADIIFCEDTRVTQKLLSLYGIKPPELKPYHDHNGEKMRPFVLQCLGEGKICVLVSDAGTPLISDPGFKLVQATRQEGFTVTPIPGASAPITALCAAGLPSNAFSFIGFPDKTQAEWYELLQFCFKLKQTLIFFERPSRLEKTFSEIKQALSSANISITIARELTKLYEEFWCGSLDDGIIYARDHQLKGEVVVLLHVNEMESVQTEQDIAEFITKNEKTSVKDLSLLLAEKFSLSKKQAYQKILETRN